MGPAWLGGVGWPEVAGGLAIVTQAEAIGFQGAREDAPAGLALESTPGQVGSQRGAGCFAVVECARLQLLPAGLVGGQVVVVQGAQEGDLVQPAGQPGEQFAEADTGQGGGDGGKGTADGGGCIGLGIEGVKLGGAANQVDPDAGQGFRSPGGLKLPGACKAQRGHGPHKATAVDRKTGGVIRTRHEAPSVAPVDRQAGGKPPEAGIFMVIQARAFTKWKSAGFRRFAGHLGRIDVLPPPGRHRPVGAPVSRPGDRFHRCGMPR